MFYVFMFYVDFEFWDCSIGDGGCQKYLLLTFSLDDENVINGVRSRKRDLQS